MTKTLTLLTLAATLATARAQNVTNLFPNGDFANGGPTADWVEVNGNAAVFTYSYPPTGGNPDGYGIIDNTAGGAWGIWVGGNLTPLPLESLGLAAGNTYTFVQDMQILAGTAIGGVKIESWGPSGLISDSGDMRPSTAGKNTAAWETYAFTYQIAFGATGLKIVPLWGPNSSVAYDNLGVVVALSSPLTTAITFPASGAFVNTNFTISASASVAPGAITNVSFYRNGALLGSDDTGPYTLNVVGAPVGPAALTAVAQSDNGNSVTSTVVNVTITANLVESIVRIDPAKTWSGFMTVYETPQNFGGQVFAQPWGTADLSAQFSGSGPTSVLTLRPAPMADAATFWYDYTDPNYPVSTNGAVANKDMEAAFYVQAPDASLSGNLVTFTGKVATNSLVTPTSTNLIGNGWTSVAFIRDFAPDYSSFVETNITLDSGTTFAFSLLTQSDPARHVQYGFRTRGPNVWPTDVTNYGAVVLESLDTNPTNVTVKSTAPWLGFMNVSNTPQDGGTYQFGSPWGLADLKATFGAEGLVLSPNNIGDANPYWYIGGGAPGATGNKIMEANLYVEIGSLPGRNLIFSGTVLSNGLVSAANTNAAGNGWTSVAFIKDFAPDYSTVNQITVPLTPGAFSVSLQTINDPARHVQYGFQTVGPNVWATDSAAFGAVVIADTAMISPRITATLSSGSIHLTFPTQTGRSYTVQHKLNLTDATWQTLTTTNGTGNPAIISDPATNTRRFYQVQVQ